MLEGDIYMVHVTDSLLKSNEFREIPLQNPVNCHAASADCPHPVRGTSLLFPRNIFAVSTERLC